MLLSNNNFTKGAGMARVFFSYSHEDELLRDQLEKHLASLKHEGYLESWHDRRILPGEDLSASIDAQINTAEVILLLVSASFLSSHYCYSIEMKRALERQASGECKVVPIILRACDWSHSPLGGLLAIPTDAKPITSWTNPDEAYADVVRGIRALLQSGSEKSSPLDRPGSAAQPQFVASAGPAISAPRSSNLRLRKSFTDFDKDQFAHASFDYIQRFFENSLAELQARNPGIQGTLRKVSDVRFTASIYRDGKTIVECAIAIGENYDRNSITYSGQLTGNSYNEILSVNADDQAVFFKTLMSSGFTGRTSKLSQEGAAEMFWERLLERLQR
ncbi:toll/interleukin-1 receptor domain-containing protein [Pseudomonas syringae]|uniref:toll/interleukin-1 receptor domain-containing protein n=1 Tax=Pseudomonas syringae TaxID=317 RepID=UPI0034D737D2